MLRSPNRWCLHTKLGALKKSTFWQQKLALHAMRLPSHAFSAAFIPAKLRSSTDHVLRRHEPLVRPIKITAGGRSFGIAIESAEKTITSKVYDRSVHGINPTDSRHKGRQGEVQDTSIERSNMFLLSNANPARLITKTKFAISRTCVASEPDRWQSHESAASLPARMHAD
ncbi:hypothetical protein [Sinorhizobium terangae]|uniref:hypothetical protein n=1 Tax=Sinorhizobium terangae TaxID=110322 RepID=UPI0024B0E14D|nr:hypothetical protein [Sinorhizobium terangae]WFU50079.1 hypothetical protein QA637_25095 [Sinorhizobium terangae]